MDRLTSLHIWFFLPNDNPDVQISDFLNPQPRLKS